MTPVILLIGDAQMQALAHVLRSLEGVARSYEVRHREAGDASIASDVERAAYVVEQSAARGRERRDRRGKTHVIVLPAVQFHLLWPLAAPNPFDRAGERPWCDTFVVAARRQNVAAGDVLAAYESTEWNASWPDLDAFFAATTTLLLGADAKADVKIGSFVLKHFRKRRLFWAPNAPSNLLLGELAFRVLHACFGREMPVTREELTQTVAALGARELMQSATLPIDPRVATHFGLEWYERYEGDPSRGEPAAFAQYVREMIDAAYETPR